MDTRPIFTRSDIERLLGCLSIVQEIHDKEKGDKMLLEKLQQYKRSLKPMDSLKIIYEHIGYNQVLAHIPEGFLRGKEEESFIRDLKERRIYGLLNTNADEINHTEEKPEYHGFKTLLFTTKSRGAKSAETQMSEMSPEELQALLEKINSKLAS